MGTAECLPLALQFFLCRSFFGRGPIDERVMNEVEQELWNTFSRQHLIGVTGVDEAARHTRKRGGLRLAVLVHCHDLTVRLCGAWRRQENPDGESFDDAFGKG